MRADAVRNRALLLEAARAVFQRDGRAAQMDAIADMAGLGVGTLYRHFPTKETLIAVLEQERTEQLLASAEAATRAADPWDGVVGLVWAIATFEAEDRGMLDILTASAGASQHTEDATPVLLERMSSVVARAQKSGQMRRDVSALDVLVAVCGVGKMMPPGGQDDEGRWRRLVKVLLDGFRAPSHA